MPSSGSKPLLSGIRILELGHFIAAPFCTRVLADLGADVIKVEPPHTGDPVRGWGAQVGGRSIWWSVHGRNKRSVTLNLKDPAARQIVLGLAAKCDAVVENFRPGQLEKWGIGPDELAKARPGLTLVRISGYGQSGPEAGKASFGVIGEAKGGLRYLTGYPKGATDLPPPRTGVSVGDSVAGLYGAVGALAAIIEQRASGRSEPRIIDVALGEAVLTLMEGVLPEYALTGVVREPMGSGMTSSAPTSGSHVAVRMSGSTAGGSSRNRPASRWADRSDSTSARTSASGAVRSRCARAWSGSRSATASKASFARRHCSGCIGCPASVRRNEPRA